VGLESSVQETILIFVSRARRANLQQEELILSIASRVHQLGIQTFLAASSASSAQQTRYL
jgi:hypothetical protein